MSRIYDEDNVFAKILRAEIPFEKVLENKYALAFNDIISKKGIEDMGFRIITNSGKDGNQDVPHFHAHVLGGKNLGRMIN